MNRRSRPVKKTSRPLGHTEHPCPRCGEPIETGDLNTGTRLRCSCGYRPYLRHNRPSQSRADICEPECLTKSHWSLGASK